jgi:hypothetical protein
MQFTVAAVVLASTAMAHFQHESVSTAYETEVLTITRCPPTVPNCPASSLTTEVTTTSYLLPTTSAEVPAVPTVEVPVPEVPSVVVPTSYANHTVGIPSHEVPQVPTTTAVELPVPTTTAVELPVPTTEAPLCPGSSVIAVTKSYTTVLTSVEYSTVEVPCATETPVVPPPVESVPVVVPPPASNTTVPVPPPSSGAGSVVGSALFAAAAGIVAVIMA